jgi:hypothetical protein
MWLMLPWVIGVGDRNRRLHAHRQIRLHRRGHLARPLGAGGGSWDDDLGDF